MLLTTENLRIKLKIERFPARIVQLCEIVKLEFFLNEKLCAFKLHFWIYILFSCSIMIESTRAFSLVSSARRKLPVINFREMPSCNWIGQFYGEKRWHPAHAARLSRRPRILGLAWTRSFIGGRGRGSNSLTRDHDQLPPRQLDNYYCRFTRAMCSTRCQRVSFIHILLHKFYDFRNDSRTIQRYINEWPRGRFFKFISE